MNKITPHVLNWITPKVTSSKMVTRMRDFFFPYEDALKEIQEENKRQITIANDNTSRIAQMMATLNGEDSWMLKRIPTKEDRSND